MSTFRPWDPEQQWLLPPSVHEFVPSGHLAHFVRDLARDSLDLDAILEPYLREGRGYPAYHPVMMTALLLYAYCRGVYSSRRIAKACEERLDFMSVTGVQKPDFRTIAAFRKRHLDALKGVFRQVVVLCEAAGLVKLGHVAIDGSKIHANASKHSAMSYARMTEAEKRIAAEVDQWFERSAEVDRREDEEHGDDRRGEELPDWVASKQRRLEKIREAKAALEGQAKAEAEAKKREQAKRKKKDGTPRKPGGRKPKTPPGTPKPKAQRNFTDPDSRIMKTKGGYEQCYNAQAAVDAENQVIVACGLTNNAADTGQLLPMVDRIEENLGRSPKEVSADSGYLSESNLEGLESRRVRGYVALGRKRHHESSAVGRRKVTPGTRTHAMGLRLRRGGWRSRYRLRKHTVEPVFGNAKYARGFTQFLLRGEPQAEAEWSLVCTAHNVLKLWHAPE